MDPLYVHRVTPRPRVPVPSVHADVRTTREKWAPRTRFVPPGFKPTQRNIEAYHREPATGPPGVVWSRSRRPELPRLEDSRGPFGTEKKLKAIEEAIRSSKGGQAPPQRTLEELLKQMILGGGY